MQLVITVNRLANLILLSLCVNFCVFKLESGRVEQELNFIKKTLGEGISTTNQILLQTPFDKNVNILNTKSLLMHLELMQLATSGKL